MGSCVGRADEVARFRGNLERSAYSPVRADTWEIVGKLRQVRPKERSQRETVNYFPDWGRYEGRGEAAVSGGFRQFPAQAATAR
jgi:hypothetical protein